MTVYPSFNPSSLFADDRQHMHRVITLAGGLNAAPVNGVATPLPRGAVLGRSANGAATSAIKAGGNTGNGSLTLAGTPVLATAKSGTYAVRMTSATAFNVTDPTGTLVSTGTVGTAYSNQIAFNTAAGGTAFVAGDGFDVAAVAPDTYVISKVGASDGSQIPVAILACDVDTSIGAQKAPAYFEGAFAGELMTFDASWTITTLSTATRINNIPLFIKSIGTIA